MHLSFRWFGPDDPVTLHHIRQIPGMTGIVTALYDVPPSQLWPEEALKALQLEIQAVGLTFEVVESLPVHEDIKLGRPSRDALIEIYCENLARLHRVGVRVICYNFMPLFDWYRTELATPFPDGSHGLSYDHTQLAGAADPWSAELPAYFPLDEHPEELKRAYRTTDKARLRDNLRYFLQGAIPTAERLGMKMAIHPDDPPWPIFGLPRIVTNAQDIQAVLDAVDSPANGLTFCTGSLGANPDNDLVAMIHRFGPRIHFAHCRNVKTTGNKQFHESTHIAADGDVDLTAVMRAYAEIGFRGPVRPDHGRMIWGEQGLAGYGLYDRALGAMYIKGAWDALVSIDG